MKNLTDLLKRFSQSLNKDTQTKEIVARIILARTGVNLSSEKISLKNGVLEISTSPAAHNEIRLKEEGITQELKEFHKIPILRILYK